MKKNYKVVVAHPDDEVIFFSSVLKSSSKTIICFNESEDKIVNEGREKIKNQLPYTRPSFLNLKEANVFNSADWSFPKSDQRGLVIKKNKINYKKNFSKLKLHLSKLINIGDIIYTHNPWGEYGHEEHVQVFKAIYDLKKKFKLKIYFNGYVSNKSYSLMLKHKNLISNIKQKKRTDKKFIEQIKKIYILNNCWTFDEFYIWPKIENFYEVNEPDKKSNYKLNYDHLSTLNIMPGNYKVNFLKKFLGKIISYKLKKKILKFINYFS